MTTTQFKLSLVVALALASLAVSLAVRQHGEARQLEQDRVAQLQDDQLAQLAVDNQRLSNLIAVATNPPARGGEQSDELLQLRGETSKLHEETRRLTELTDALKASGEGMSDIIARLPPDTVTNTLPRTNVFHVATLWDAGTRTLDNALQTVLFAYSSSNVEIIKRLAPAGSPILSGRSSRGFDLSIERLQGLAEIFLIEQEEHLDGSVQILCQLKYGNGAGADSAAMMRVRLRPAGGKWVMDSFPMLVMGGRGGGSGRGPAPPNAGGR